ncbi:MAG: sortase [Chloroflexota bacterium]
MLGRISARTGVRQKDNEVPGDGGRSAISRLFERSTRARSEQAPATLEIEPAPVQEEFDRFRAVRLSQVGVQGKKWQRAQTAEGRAENREPAVSYNRFDRALLGLELVGALVIAWLAFQYVYTVYFDTGVRRISGSGTSSAPAQVVRGASAPLATGTHVAEVAPPLTGAGPEVTPTRIAEVAPPLTGAGTGRPAGTQVPAAMETQAPTATPTVDPQLLLPTRLRIPVMFLDSDVHEVTVNLGQWEVSPMDIGHHEGSGDPGRTGNVVLAGHRDINSALFRELDRLQPGDEVFVSNGLGEYRYVVQESFEVSPDDTNVMAPTNDKRVTLITCTPVGIDTRRLIVVATLDESWDGAP